METDTFDDMLVEKNKYNKNHLSQYIIQLKSNNYTDANYRGDSNSISVSDSQWEEFISHNQDFANRLARDIIVKEFGKCSPIYDIVKRHLFGYYVNKTEYGMED